MNVAIVKYNAGNIFSVKHALKRLGIAAEVSANPEVLTQADKVIFPGVGEAKTTMEYLRHTGMDKLIQGLKQPVLGICLGMQLMCRHSDEGNVDCLHIFDTDVKHFEPENPEDKVPHMGWNSLRQLKGPLFEGVDEDEFVYFVHSFYVPDNACNVATADYILPFCAALQQNNFYATQFHPEKSGKIGEKILSNFLSL